MANQHTPDDPRARELDEHFEHHVVESSHDEPDLYVTSGSTLTSISEAEARRVADDVDGIEYIAEGDINPLGHNFKYVPDSVGSESGSCGEPAKVSEDDRSFEEYMADEHGYSPEDALWMSREDANGGCCAPIEFRTAFHANLRQFRDDENVIVKYARTDTNDESLAIGLEDAR